MYVLFVSYSVVPQSVIWKDTSEEGEDLYFGESDNEEEEEEEEEIRTATSTLPLYVLPLYSTLSPEQQSKVWSMYM